MPKATIKSRTGAVIAIEGTHEEISRIIADFEKSAVMIQARSEFVEQKAQKRAEKKRRAASDLVVELKDEGFFDKPRALSEISEALEEKGRIIPVTSLSGIMISLVQNKTLQRKKIDGKQGKKWGYVK
ncbi:MAG: hypothetical protein AAB699_01860 [Patescibacteria group bacterium]